MSTISDELLPEFQREHWTAGQIEIAARRAGLGAKHRDAVAWVLQYHVKPALAAALEDVLFSELLRALDSVRLNRYKGATFSNMPLNNSHVVGIPL